MAAITTTPPPSLAARDTVRKIPACKGCLQILTLYIFSGTSATTVVDPHHVDADLDSDYYLMRIRRADPRIRIFI
jgi:hypothetical protein